MQKLLGVQFVLLYHNQLLQWQSDTDVNMSLKFLKCTWQLRFPVSPEQSWHNYMSALTTKQEGFPCTSDSTIRCGRTDKWVTSCVTLRRWLSVEFECYPCESFCSFKRAPSKLVNLSARYCGPCCSEERAKSRSCHLLLMTNYL